MITDRGVMLDGNTMNIDDGNRALIRLAEVYGLPESEFYEGELRKTLSDDALSAWLADEAEEAHRWINTQLLTGVYAGWEEGCYIITDTGEEV